MGGLSMQEDGKVEVLMKLRGSGMLTSKDGGTTTEVQYSITQGERKTSETTHTFDGVVLPMDGKKEADQIILIPSENVALIEEPGSFILRTEDGHCFTVVVEQEISPNIFAAKGSERECP
jgi:hypothetical protein